MRNQKLRMILTWVTAGIAGVAILAGVPWYFAIPPALCFSSPFSRSLGDNQMRKGTLIAIGIGVAAGALLIAPDAWATTGFQKDRRRPKQGYDRGNRNWRCGVQPAESSSCATGWRFGHGCHRGRRQDGLSWAAASAEPPRSPPPSWAPVRRLPG